MQVKDVLDETSGLLNDTGRSLYSYAAMLPYFKKAWLELQNKLILNGMPYPLKIASPVTIAAAATTYGTVPTDMVTPIKMREASVGGTDWIPMRKTVWEPDDPQGASLGVWDFRNGSILFRGATQARQVKLYYNATLTTIVDETTTIPLDYARSVLAARVGALCAEFIGEDRERAASLNADFMANLDLAIDVGIQERQNLPKRRLPWRSKSMSRLGLRRI